MVDQAAVLHAGEGDVAVVEAVDEVQVTDIEQRQKDGAQRLQKR